jgi:uncharacterized RDD family membrane protein YckC
MVPTVNLDPEYRLETPESIEVSFELAGPGSRFCAVVIDTLLTWVMVFAVMVAACIADVYWVRDLGGRHGAGGEGLSDWGTAVLILIVALVLFGYSVFFEILLRGQTPGKRALKLRVIRDDGTPATVMDLCVRNLVRVVDFLPAFYLVGGLVAFFSTTNKRLGDIAAGTIVVKEAELDYRAKADAKAVFHAPDVAVSNTALTPEEQRVIRAFLQRRAELLPDARLALAERLARGLYEKHGGQYSEPEAYLERLSEGRHYES